MTKANESTEEHGWRSWWASRGDRSEANSQEVPNLESTNSEPATSTSPEGVAERNMNIGQDTVNSTTTPDDRATLENENVGWYTSFLSRVSAIPIFNSRNPNFTLDAGVKYSQLNDSQIKYLEDEALQMVVRRTNSWCWFEDLTLIKKDTSSWAENKGVLSVHGTSSQRCPLPLKSYPVPEANPGYHVYLKDSLIIPSDSPLEVLHMQPMMSKVATAVKNYYNFPSEKHLYLKKNTVGLLRSRKVLIISVVGSLPVNYEKFSLKEQRSAHYLSKKLAQSLEHEVPSSIVSLSLECPLDSKDLKTVFGECVALLDNWKHVFADVSSIFVTSIYHSVPLAIFLTKYILEHHETLKFDSTIPVGILALESNLQGYRFWDHSSDANNNNEQNYQKIQQAREKQLFQGVGKSERGILSNIRHYRKLNSTESKLVQRNLDWLLFHCEGFRLNLFGKLYDNFMTASQKLAIDYTHPKIFRNLWCDGRYLGHDLKHSEKLGVPDVHIITPDFECSLKIPENRAFEISLLSNILLALNLGNSEFVPIMKLISPFFISRSFNENTISANLKKQVQAESRVWLQEMDAKWRSTNSSESYQAGLPESVSSVHKFLEFSLYHDIRSPELVKLYSEIYDDDLLYKTFIENTIKTRSPLNEKHLKLLDDHSAPQSILNTVNQYDLVWKFHEFLSDYVKLRNLPHQEFPSSLMFGISLGYSHWKQSYADPSMFQRDNSEAIARLKQIWDSYQSWDPPTRGLKQLKNILSVLSLYNESSDLLHDIAGN